MAAEEQETIGFKVGTPLVPSAKKFSNPFGFTQDNEREEPANRVSVGKVNPFGGLGLVENHGNGPEVRKGRGRPPKNTDPGAPAADNTRKRELKADSKGFTKPVENPESAALPEPKPKKFQKRDRSIPKPALPIQHASSLIRSTPPGNPFSSILPQSSKYAGMFTFNQAGPNFNPFLKKKLNKTLCATPSKFEIRHDAPTKMVKEAK